MLWAGHPDITKNIQSASLLWGLNAWFVFWNVSRLEESLQDCSQPDIPFPLLANSAAATVATSIPPPTPAMPGLYVYYLGPSPSWERSVKKKIFRKQVGILVCSVTSQLNHKVIPPIYLYIYLFTLSLQQENISNSFNGQLSWCICFMYSRL